MCACTSVGVCASVCAFACMHAAVLPRGALLGGTRGLLRWYLRDINGEYSRVLEGHLMAYSMAYSCFCQAVLKGFSRAHGVHSGVLRGYSQKVCTCV